MEDSDVLDVLRAYPRIYLSCHVEHRTRSKSPSGLTERDGSLLAHIDEQGSSPAALARHLGVSPSTLSAALGRLEADGFVRLDRVELDARRRRVILTREGKSALLRSSVLDPQRVSDLLRLLDPAERRRAVEGLKLLAAAATKYQEQKN